MSRRTFVVIIAVLVVLAAGTITNTLRQNEANARFQANAEAGQRGLDRQCSIRPVSRKLYAWALLEQDRSKITADDVALVLDTAAQACGTRP